MPVIANIEDLRRLARRRLPRALFDYVDGGSYDEISHRANREDLEAIRFRQRVLIDASDRKLATTERRRLLVPVPYFMAKLQAMALQFMPKPMLTPDQVELLRADNVVSETARAEGRTLEGLGITPDTIQTIVPTYLWRFRKAGQFRGRLA